RGVGLAAAVGEIGTDAGGNVEIAEVLRRRRRGSADEREGDERAKGITFHCRGLLSFRWYKACARPISAGRLTRSRTSRTTPGKRALNTLARAQGLRRGV